MNKWLSEKYWNDSMLAGQHQTGIFIPGPNEPDTEIHMVHYNWFKDPMIVNGTFTIARSDQPTVNLHEISPSIAKELYDIGLSGEREGTNIVTNISSVGCVLGNLTIGTSLGGSIPYLGLERMSTLFNDVRIKGVVFNSSTLLELGMFKINISYAWNMLTSIFSPLSLGHVPDKILLMENYRFPNPSTKVEGEVLVHATPLNYTEAMEKLENSSIDSPGSRFMIDLVGHVDEQFVSIEVRNSWAEVTDVWWVLMPYGPGSPVIPNTYSMNVTESGIALFNRFLHLEFAGPTSASWHIGVGYGDI